MGPGQSLGGGGLVLLLKHGLKISQKVSKVRVICKKIGYKCAVVNETAQSSQIYY